MGYNVDTLQFVYNVPQLYALGLVLFVGRVGSYHNDNSRGSRLFGLGSILIITITMITPGVPDHSDWVLY